VLVLPALDTLSRDSVAIGTFRGLTRGTYNRVSVCQDIHGRHDRWWRYSPLRVDAIAVLLLVRIRW
jgi:hypothetical protein